ncbi:N-sulfoglucosamine sulfohydrolase [Planctomycetales bacterium 10988]|nr:N-sulfoglucosamine sulfohydrolase [Planctomycetales bacterium 10988]
MFRFFLPCWLLLACLPQLSWSQEQASAAPNIFLFYADDWVKIASCYANPEEPSLNDVIETPHIDRIALEGVQFNNAFFPVPQCSPCRGSLVSGSYFWRCGTHAFLRTYGWGKAPNPMDDLPCFPEILEQQGYHTAKAVKTLPFEPSPPAGKKQISKKAQKKSSQQFLRYGLHVSQAKTEAERKARHQEVVDQTRAMILEVLANTPPGKPFFFVFGPINTHRPFALGSGKELWGIEPDSIEGKVPPFLPDVPAVREDLADYLGEILALDLMLGVILEELESAKKLDETLVVLTGDNGAPGFPRGKTQLYDFGTAAPLMARLPGVIEPGRQVSDMVNIMDLAPTFLELAGAEIPAEVDGESLMPQLTAKQNGQIVPERDAVVFGRERHFVTARPGFLPYPARAIRTEDFLYIENLKPKRWPLGNPYDLDPDNPPPFETLMDYENLGASPFRDLDNSLTKAWVISQRNTPGNRKFYRYAFARRPAEELYDLRKDPHQLDNLAEEAAYAEVKNQLAERLLQVRSSTNDPRLQDTFDRPPYIETGFEALPERLQAAPENQEEKQE